MNILPIKSDLFIENKNIKINTNIKVITNILNNNTYKTIYFKDYKDNKIINKLKKELLYYFNKYNINKNNHILVVGLGNDNQTSDSIGPKVLKYIKVNSYLDIFNFKYKTCKISALEPGVMAETGIRSNVIIKSVVNKIKPDILIVIDAIVSSNINYLNSTIEISDKGINPGSGLKGYSFAINKKYIGIPVIAIGATSAIEIKFSDSNINYVPYLLSTKDVDLFVNSISKTIGIAINKSIENLK